MASERDLVVLGTEQLTALAARLRAAGDDSTGLKRELRAAIRQAAKPATDDVKHAVEDLAVRGVRGGGKAARAAHQASRSKRGKVRKPTGLRATIARAIKLDTNLGRQASVRIRVSQSQLPEDQRTLPAHLDSRKGWRHPVFGNRDTWAQQFGGPWFAQTLRQHATDVRRQILQAMKTISDKIVR